MNKKQLVKWKELDTFFKNNSKHYKKIDNNEVVFIVFEPGSGGDFITGLFSNTLAESNISQNRYYSFLTLSMQDRFLTTIALSKYDQQYKEQLTKQYMDIIKKLKLPTDFLIDDILKKIFNTPKRDVWYYKMHNLPIIPYFYYKNLNKIKILIIDINDKITLNYIHSLANFKLPPENTKIAAHLANMYWSTNSWSTKTLYKDTSSIFCSGMMDFLPNEQLYKIDYKKLVIEQNNTLIEQLMQFFNSKQDIIYYKTQIKLYHERNLKII